MPGSVTGEGALLGPKVTGFTIPPAPGLPLIEAPWARLERLDPARHGAALHDAVAGHDQLWDYMGQGPFADAAEFGHWLEDAAAGADPCFYAIVPADGLGGALGHAAFMRIDRPMGVIEIGNILLSPALQRSRTASAALMAMIGWAFGAGYRRVEWKCNALNLASRRAAMRLGFGFEGVFRQHMIVKGRNRDTAWFAITDADWPALSRAWAAWLDAANFDASGRQRQSLSALTAAALPDRIADPLPAIPTSRPPRPGGPGPAR
ncbi:GNAT family N-acetyltransferase [Paracoccus siganidrum]|uniref:N-acetyltransferase n=1 Tax=Paracoccus siganidrum TaxID=1276757 RepID=A0A419A460_9RHOB|nr:GNAT family protein [Paracoccus siganidrum]RJL08498.1 N-acetyltransferase [Paracoccus siganidrum]RMC30063.1 N-acetyltransferase [Paracoccus siganidrum]